MQPGHRKCINGDFFQQCNFYGYFPVLPQNLYCYETQCIPSYPRVNHLAVYIV